MPSDRLELTLAHEPSAVQEIDREVIDLDGEQKKESDCDWATNQNGKEAAKRVTFTRQRNVNRPMGSSSKEKSVNVFYDKCWSN